MTTEEKSIQFFSGSKRTGKGWCKMFLVRRRWKDYHMLLIGAYQKEGVDKVPTKESCDWAVGSMTANSKKFWELYHFNEVSFEDLILLVDHKSTTGKVGFHLI